MPEVMAVERGEQEQWIKQALEWEELSFAKAREEVFLAADDERENLRSNLQVRGVFHSSMHIGGVIESHVRMMERLVQARIDLRRELARKMPELGSSAYLADLKQALDTFIDATWAALPGIIVGSYRGGESEDHFRQLVKTGQWADTLLRLKLVAEREIEMLKREVGLGMLESKGPGVVLNITDSNVAALNLGNVMGNIQAFVVSLQNEGNPDLARALKTLIEGVAATEELGAQRTELIEYLTTIGEQAALQQTQRRPGVVKTLMNSLGSALMHAANLAQIWQTVAPMIARHFGLNWPW